MKSASLIAGLALSLFMIGCASFSTHVFRTEQAAVNVVYGTYVVYTNSLSQLNLSPAQSNAIKQARLQFAASVQVLDAWREAYETNAINRSYVESALSATVGQSSNFLWLVTYLKSGGK